MKIKKLKELHGLNNGMFEIRYCSVNKELSIWNTQYNHPMQVIENIEDIKLYGFTGIVKMEKANIDTIEAVADENNVAPTYNRGSWYYRQNGELKSLTALLNEYNYYV